MKTKINSNYNKKVLVRGNSLSDVNTLTENEMMLYTEQKDNEPVTKVVPSKIITKINGETKSYKVGGTKIIKNVTSNLVTSFRSKDVYPIYIYSVNKLAGIIKTKDENADVTTICYDGSCTINIVSLLKKKIKRFYLLFYIPEFLKKLSLSLFVVDSNEEGEDILLSTILHLSKDGDYYNMIYLGHSYVLLEIDITDKKNIIVKKASSRDIGASDYFTLDGTYYLYSPQKHQYLSLDTRFTGDKQFNSFYLFEGLVDLDRIYINRCPSPRLYIPIEKIRKTNHCLRELQCDVIVPPSKDWEKEAAHLIEAKLNYRNFSIRGFNETMEPIVDVYFKKMVPDLSNSKIFYLHYYEGIEFRLYPDSEDYYLNMHKTISVTDASLR